MAVGRREKDIKLLVAKFVKLVESLNPGERLSIRKITAKKATKSKGRSRRAAAKTAKGGSSPKAKRVSA